MEKSKTKQYIERLDYLWETKWSKSSNADVRITIKETLGYLKKALNSRLESEYFEEDENEEDPTHDVINKLDEVYSIGENHSELAHFLGVQMAVEAIKLYPNIGKLMKRLYEVYSDSDNEIEFLLQVCMGKGDAIYLGGIVISDETARLKREGESKLTYLDGILQDYFRCCLIVDIKELYDQQGIAVKFNVLEPLSSDKNVKAILEARGGTDLNKLESIVMYIQSDVFFSTLGIKDTGTLVNYIYSYKDSNKPLFDAFKNSLSTFSFTPSTLAKMQMTGVDNYRGLSVSEATLIQFLKTLFDIQE